ncbi:MAG: DUF58 domain-containing protein [Clostridia bacterium]|nr:DUF58 domain-containing protein [Clostridia bacterium]
MKRNRILFTALLVSSLIYLYFYGGKIPYMFLYTTLTVFSVSFLYTFIVYERFKYIQEVDKTIITKGDRINFLFSINNEDFLLYPYVKVTFCGSGTIFSKQFQTKSLSLLPNSKKTFAFELECKYRGHYAIGIEKVEIDDFLGIFRFTYSISEPKYITVYPKLIYIDRFKLRTNYFSETHSILDNKFEDMTTISDIRKYSYGDSFKKIHWKLTAKAGEMMVKNFQSTSETSATVVIDLKKNNYPIDVNAVIEDKLIESAIAIIHYCLSNWIPVNIVFYSESFNSISLRNPSDFDEIYKVLAKVSFNGNANLNDILNIYLDSNILKTNFVILSSNIDYDLYDQIYKTKMSGNEVSLVYVYPSEHMNGKSNDVFNILSNLPEVGIDIYKMDIDDDIKSVLER